jgi:hypothetical protein
MADDYILPGEFAALVAFWFAPPLLVAFAFQAWFFAARGILRRHRMRVAGVFLATTCVSVVVGIAALIASPRFLPVWLGVRDISLGGHH